MKNFRLLLTVTLLTGFCATQTIDKEDRENAKKEASSKPASQNSASQNDTSSEMLPKVKIFQEFTKAFPRVVSSRVAALKGIATFSSEPQEVKDCAMALAKLIEESQKITTEEQAQRFAKKFMNKLAECAAVAEKEANKMVKDHKNLPYIKIAQQTMKTFPAESQALIGFMAMQSMNQDLPLDERRKAKEALELFTKIAEIKTEEEAQAFVKKLIDIAEKNRR